MALVAFLAVYREMFETALFYQALWVQAGEAGRGRSSAASRQPSRCSPRSRGRSSATACGCPLGPFFTATSLLLCALAVVLAGKGVAALQEAGVIHADPIAFIRVPALGIFPTSQSLARRRSCSRPSSRCSGTVGSRAPPCRGRE